MFTNIVKDQLPIKGSKGLRCSLQELLGIAYRIPLIVSVQSGVLEFIANSHVNMFVICGSVNRDETKRQFTTWCKDSKVKEVAQSDIVNDPDLTIFKQFLSEIEG